MTSLDKLISLLDLPDDEIWANVWEEDARQLLIEKHAELLPAILKQWRTWPINRQEHMAFILGHVGSPDEKTLAIEMLAASDPRVRNRAKEALDEL